MSGFALSEDRARCSEHGLLIADDGRCIRCRRTHDQREAHRGLRRIVLVVAMLVAVALVWRVGTIVSSLGLLRLPSSSAANASTGGQLFVYTTSTCPHCRRARAWLDARGVAYVERNIDDDDAARRELAARGRLIVPTFAIDGDIQQGMDAQGVLVERLLAKHALGATPSSRRDPAAP